jgi:gamma-carbonic anhydrase
VPPKSLILGSPAKVKRPVTVEELAWIKESAENYVKYAGQYMASTSKAKPGFRIS